MNTDDVKKKLKSTGAIVRSISVPGYSLPDRISKKDIINIDLERMSETAMLIRKDPELKIDWLENLSAIHWGKYVILNYFLRATESAYEIILRGRAQIETVSGSMGKILEKVKVQSVCRAWPMAKPFELEISDLFGVDFVGGDRKSLWEKPGSRTFLPDEGISGFPLRKDFKFPEKIYGIAHTLESETEKGDNGNGSSAKA